MSWGSLVCHCIRGSAFWDVSRGGRSRGTFSASINQQAFYPSIWFPSLLLVKSNDLQSPIKQAENNWPLRDSRVKSMVCLGVK